MHPLPHTALHSTRDSKLGTQLKESTIRRIIVIVYSLFFFLPPLVYQPVDGAFRLGMQIIHSANTDLSLSFDNKQAILRDFVTRIHEQYGEDSIAHLSVIPLNTLPIINRIDIFDAVRPEEMFNIIYTSTVNDIEYVTSATFSNHSIFVRQAGRTKIIIFFPSPSSFSFYCHFLFRLLLSLSLFFHFFILFLIAFLVIIIHLLSFFLQNSIELTIFPFFFFFFFFHCFEIQ
jgi:hypothetical protein